MAGIVQSAYPREFVYSKGDRKEESSFRILQWNILADGLSYKTPTLGGFLGLDAKSIDKSLLEWSYRKELILEVIDDLKPDLIALEELDHFEDVMGALAKRGYEGIFAKKDPSPCLQYSDKPDGCGLFVRAGKLRFCDRKKFVKEFRYSDKKETLSQVALIAKVALIDGGAEFLAVATHLKATKSASGEKIRELEANQLRTELKKLSTQWKNGEELLPCIVLTDLNASPKNNGYEPLAYTSMKKDFLSVYQDLSHDGEEPPVTTFKKRDPSPNKVTSHCIDYVFYRSAPKAVFRPIGMLQLPDLQGRNVLPNEAYPSDHFHLAADFIYKPYVEDNLKL